MLLLTSLLYRASNNSAERGYFYSMLSAACTSSPLLFSGRLDARPEVTLTQRHEVSAEVEVSDIEYVTDVVDTVER